MSAGETRLDPRTTLILDGLADSRLEGVVPAARYTLVRPAQAVVGAAAMRAAPDANSEQVSQLIFGEAFDRLEDRGRFVFGQARRDGYCGWVETAALADEVLSPTHWVKALRTFAFAKSSIKASARGPVGLNALVTVIEEGDTLARAERLGWIARAHLAPIGESLGDPAAVAMAHLGAPYLWGGRDSAGLDCSGLVQQALLACGRAAPRDSDQQQTLGAPAPADALARGDLVFWKGHAGLMLDARRLCHANAFHMAVAVEPLAKARARIAAGGGGEPIAFRRLGRA